MIPPTIATISPAGMKRGETVLFTMNGRSLSDASEVIFDAPGLSGKITGITDIPEKITGPRAGEDLGAQVPLGKKQTATIEISAAKDAMPGIHRFRVKTPWGTSNMTAFAVGTLREIQSQEPSAQDSAAHVRVTVSFNADGQEPWITAGVSSDLNQAALMAIVDGFHYWLLLNEPETGQEDKASTYQENENIS